MSLYASTRARTPTLPLLSTGSIQHQAPNEDRPSRLARAVAPAPPRELASEARRPRKAKQKPQERCAPLPIPGGRRRPQRASRPTRARAASLVRDRPGLRAATGPRFVAPRHHQRSRWRIRSRGFRRREAEVRTSPSATIVSRRERAGEWSPLQRSRARAEVAATRDDCRRRPALGWLCRVCLLRLCSGTVAAFIQQNRRRHALPRGVGFR